MFETDFEQIFGYCYNLYNRNILFMIHCYKRSRRLPSGNDTVVPSLSKCLIKTVINGHLIINS